MASAAVVCQVHQFTAIRECSICQLVTCVSATVHIFGSECMGRGSISAPTHGLLLFCAPSDVTVQNTNPLLHAISPNKRIRPGASHIANPACTKTHTRFVAMAHAVHTKSYSRHVGSANGIAAPRAVTQAPASRRRVAAVFAAAAAGGTARPRPEAPRPPPTANMDRRGVISALLASALLLPSAAVQAEEVVGSVGSKVGRTFQSTHTHARAACRC